jgi:hypothetical protein
VPKNKQLRERERESKSMQFGLAIGPKFIYKFITLTSMKITKPWSMNENEFDGLVQQNKLCKYLQESFF